MKSGDHSSGEVLRVDGVAKAFGESRVLDSLSLSVHRGERLALMGPSGSGKSTLLSCLGGLEEVDSGGVWLKGRDIARLSEREMDRFRSVHIGTVFQFFNLLPTLNAYENVELPLLLLRVSAAERHSRVRGLLEEVGLSHRASGYPSELSGGEMQRVAIARAFVHHPGIVLADEPTGNLDSKTGVQVLELMKDLSLRHRMAILMATHDRSSARICDRVVEMRDGRLEEVAIGA